MSDIVHIKSVKNLKQTKKMLDDLLLIERNMDICSKTLEKYDIYISVANVLVSLRSNLKLINSQKKICETIINNKGLSK